jgi:hypothetical protein
MQHRPIECLKQNIFPIGAAVIGLCIFLAGCSVQPTAVLPQVSKPLTSTVVPPGVYQKQAQEEYRIALANKGIKLATAHVSTDSSRLNPTAGTVAADASKPIGPVVWLFSSPSTQVQLLKTGVDASVNTRVWDTFLRKYKIPFNRISNAEGLARMGSGVLLLPSVVVLSDAEKLAIANFRAQGGSVLATWLNGVRNDTGDWLGFDFMQKTLGARVAGNTEDAEDDNFMIVYGDNPITNHLPAGTRVWLDRIKDLLPLRLSAQHHAAEIMDWSRTFTPEKTTGLITFEERKVANGMTSRVVVLGYPEQLWLSADPKSIEAIAYNALNWLFRQPQAYVAAWPFPRQAGFVMAVEAGEELAEVDLDFAKKLEGVGARGTYYILGESSAKSATVVRKIQARGHEIAYLGDKFDGFKDQPLATQGKRLETMRKMVEDAGIKINTRASFSAPMDSYDKVTQQLLLERGFDNYIAFMDASDGRLPVFAKLETDVRKSTVILPRTQTGPEESIEEGDPDEGLQKFLDELELSIRMGGLAISRIPAQSILTPEQQQKIFGYLQTKKDKLWMTTARNVAQWWRDRARIAARLEPTDKGLQLKVTVLGALSPKDPVAVWINLPYAGAHLQLESPTMNNPLPATGVIDAWRTAVILDELIPGEYEWYVHFEKGTSIISDASLPPN